MFFIVSLQLNSELSYSDKNILTKSLVEVTKDVALVLSSGGARGLAHIGAIEELEAQGYRITSIAGCSMGALIGGVYAAGKLKEFREWMKTVDRKRMLELTDFSLSINHIAKGSRILSKTCRYPIAPWLPT